MDCSIAGVDWAAQLSERLFYHGPGDVTATAPMMGEHRDQIARVIDVKGAHTLMKIHESDQGLLLFQTDYHGICG